MPQAIPVAAAFVAKALVAVGASTAFAKVAGVFIVKTAVAVAVNAAATALLRPDVDRAGSPTEWQADPNAGIPFAMGGPQAVGGRIVHRREFGPENMYVGSVTVLSGAGPVHGIDELQIEGVGQTFGANQQSTSGYGDKMYWSYQLGEQPESAALASPSILRAGATLTGWTSSHKLSGKAADMWTLGHDDVGDVYPGGSEPGRKVLLTGGILLYDPRNDDTQTAIGGSGDERWDDRDTWDYATNPIIGALNWALGLYENGKRVGGMGIPIASIELDMFADAANVADLNGWDFSAYPTTVDDKWQVFLALLQAGGAVPCSVNGKLGCWSRATSKTSLYTITEADLAGPVELALSNSRLDRINTIHAACRLESAQWEVATLGSPVSVDGLTEEDGGVRSREVQYRYVTDVDQAARLAAYDIMDSREPLAGVVPCKPHLRDLRAGDAFTLDLGVRGLEGLKCIVLRRPDFDVEQGVCRIAFRSETDAKHTLASGVTGDPPDPVDPPTRPDVPTPPGTDWTLTGGGRTGPTGGVIPGLFISGAATDTPNVSRILLEMKVDGTDSLIHAAQGPRTTTTFEITNVAPETDYEVFIAYYDAAGRGPGPRTSLGVVTTGAIVVSPTPAFTALAAPTNAYKSRSGAGSITTNSVTVTPEGGTGPYAYAWTYVSGDTFTVSSASSATTTFSATLAAGETRHGVYRCTITDSLSATASVDVPVTGVETS